MGSSILSWLVFHFRLKLHSCLSVFTRWGGLKTSPVAWLLFYFSPITFGFVCCCGEAVSKFDFRKKYKWQPGPDRPSTLLNRNRNGRLWGIRFPNGTNVCFHGFLWSSPSTCLPICLRPGGRGGRKQIGRQVKGEEQTFVPLGTLFALKSAILWLLLRDPKNDRDLVKKASLSRFLRVKNTRKSRARKYQKMNSAILLSRGSFQPWRKHLWGSRHGYGE